MSMSKDNTLQYGDFILINSEKAPYLITYVDNDIIKIMNITGNEYLMNRQDDKLVLDNKIIESISIIKKTDKLGFVEYHNITIGTVLHIYFENMENYVSGTVINIENDSIDLSINEEGEDPEITINFDYKGIPLDSGIKLINVVEAEPIEAEEQSEELIEKNTEEEVEEPIEEPNEEETVDDNTSIGNMSDFLYIEDNKDFNTNIIYGLDEQCTDLFEKILMQLNANQNVEHSYLNFKKAIQEIERYKEVRQRFSEFDENGMIISKLKNLGYYPFESYDKYSWRPITKYLIDMNKPISNFLYLNIFTTCKIYNEEENKLENLNYEFVNLENDLTILSELSQNNYQLYINNIFDILQPFKYHSDNTETIYSSKIYHSLNSLITVKNEKMTVFNKLISIYNNPESELKFNTNDIANISGITFYPLTSTNIYNTNMSSVLEKSTFQHRYQYENMKEKSITIRNLSNSFVETEQVNISSLLNYKIKYDIRDKLIQRNNPNSNTLFKQFLYSIIPNTSQFIDLIFKYSGKVFEEIFSLNDLIKLLINFGIEIDDFDKKHYELAIQYISSNIYDKIENYYQKIKDISEKLITYYQSIPNKKNNILDTLNSDKLSVYFAGQDISQLSNSEILYLVLKTDNMKLLHQSLVYQNIETLSNPDLFSILKEEGKNLKSIDINTKIINKKCVNYPISKEYLSIDDLTNDNNIELLFYDKKYDDLTRMTKYKNIYTDLLDISPDNKLKYIKEILISSYGINQDSYNFDILAESILYEKRPIKDGDYAILIEKINTDLYFRKNNTWIKDTNVTPTIKEYIANNIENICLIQEDCWTENVMDNILNTPSCSSMDLMKDKMLYKVFENVIYEYSKYTKQDTVKSILSKIDIQSNNINSVFDKKESEYNKQKIELSSLYNANTNIIKSPNEELFYVILKIEDETKKNLLLKQFVETLTRPSNGLNESQYWRYCLTSGAKLVPTFLYTLSNAFLLGYSYYEKELNNIIKFQGAISDQGDSIVDKESGFFIKQIDAQVDEYDTLLMVEDTFKEIDIDDPETTIYIVSRDERINKLIFDIIDVIITNMKISVSDNKINYIINTTNELMNNKIELNKKLETIMEKTGEGSNDVLIFFITISLLFIIIQTNVPPIISKENTFNCIVSYEGFPLYNEEKYSGINYISCINEYLLETPPHSMIFKTTGKNSKIITKNVISDIMIFIIRTSILQRPDINTLINKKLKYNEMNKNADIPISRTLNTFLPYDMKEVIINPPEPLKLTDKSKHSILMIFSKMREYSFYIQSVIEKIKTQSVDRLAINNINVYEELLTYDKDGTLNLYKNKIIELSKAIKKYDITYKFENKSKMKIINYFQFDNILVYKFYVHYIENIQLVWYNTISAEDMELLILPEGKYSIISKINMLKNKYNISLTSNDIPHLISLNYQNKLKYNYFSDDINVIDNFKNNLLSNKTKLSEELFNVIDAIVEYDNNIVKEIETFDNYLKKTTNEYNDYLCKELNTSKTANMKKKIYTDFISIDVFNYNDIQSANILNMRISNDNYGNGIEFLKQALINIGVLFPTIILNRYTMDDISTPDNLKKIIAEKHANKLLDLSKKNYSELKNYFDSDINDFLEEIIQFSKPIILSITTFIDVIKTSTTLFEYHFIIILKLLKLGIYSILNEYLIIKRLKFPNKEHEILKLIYYYINEHQTIKSTINLNYDQIKKRIFILKTNERARIKIEHRFDLLKKHKLKDYKIDHMKYNKDRFLIEEQEILRELNYKNDDDADVDDEIQIDSIEGYTTKRGGIKKEELDDDDYLELDLDLSDETNMEDMEEGYYDNDD